MASTEAIIAGPDDSGSTYEMRRKEEKFVQNETGDMVAGEQDTPGEKVIKEEVVKEERNQGLGEAIPERVQQVRDALEEASFVAEYHINRFLLRTFLVLSLMFLINGIILYFGTLMNQVTGYGFNVARFYTEVEFPNFHLQKTSGVFFLGMFLLNLYAWKQDSDKVSFITFVFDMIVGIHFGIETFYFRAVRMEVFLFMAFFFVVNTAWAMKEYLEKKKREDTAGVTEHDRAMAQMDKSVREEDAKEDRDVETKKNL